MKLRFAPLLLLVALSLASLTAPAQANYRQKAEEQTDFIQAHFYDASAKRYHASYPNDPKALPYDFMWANGVQFPVLAAAARYDPIKYKPLLLDFFDGLQTYWDPAGKPPGFNAWCSGPGGTDKYYDDNAWMVLDFVDAYQNTGDARFLKAAQDTQKFVLSGWDEKLGGGIYWKLDHQSKNTCVVAPAAAAALRLAQVGNSSDQAADQMVWAVRLRDWTNKTLQDKDGLYWDNINLDGKIQTAKWTYNSGLMIRTDVLFYDLGHNPDDLREARRVADAALAAWTDPATGSLQKTENSPRFTHLLCEALLSLYDATHDLKYLNAVRRQAAFGYRVARDPAGGYRDHWTVDPPKPDERKSLIENASAARLFWMLAPYQDVDELSAAGVKAAANKQDARAELLLHQAFDSDPQAVEAGFRLWRVLTREKKTAAANKLAADLAVSAQNPALKARLEAAGWKPL